MPTQRCAASASRGPQDSWVSRTWLVSLTWFYVLLSVLCCPIKRSEFAVSALMSLHCVLCPFSSHLSLSPGDPSCSQRPSEERNAACPFEQRALHVKRGVQRDWSEDGLAGEGSRGCRRTWAWKTGAALTESGQERAPPLPRLGSGPRGRSKVHGGQRTHRGTALADLLDTYPQGLAVNAPCGWQGKAVGGEGP